MAYLYSRCLIGRICFSRKLLSFLFCYQISWTDKGIVADAITIGVHVVKGLSSVIAMHVLNV